MPSAIGRNTPFHNEILAALSIEDAEAIRPHLHLVTLTSNQVLYEHDSSINDVFFVEDGVVSLAATAALNNGRGRSGFDRPRGTGGCTSDAQSRALFCSSSIHPGSRRCVSHEFGCAEDRH